MNYTIFNSNKSVLQIYLYTLHTNSHRCDQNDIFFCFKNCFLPPFLGFLHDTRNLHFSQSQTHGMIKSLINNNYNLTMQTEIVNETR